MRGVFVDTSALVALFDRRDENHQFAKAGLEKIKADRMRMFITDYIFDECITTVLSAAGHNTAIKVGEFILDSKVIEMVWLDETLKMRAWDYFKKHADKSFSFTDCTSFVIMKERGINKFFSFDSDFKQAGFVEY